jgi:hypothetical protein
MIARTSAIKICMASDIFFFSFIRIPSLSLPFQVSGIKNGIANKRNAFVAIT